MDAIITKIGLEKISKATVDTPLILKYFGVGDGDIALDINTTQLINLHIMLPISCKYTHNNNLALHCVIDKNTPIKKSFYIKEIGIFDDAKNLIAIAKISPSYREKYNKNILFINDIYDIKLQIANSNKIQVFPSQRTKVARNILDELLKEIQNLENINKG